MREIAQVKQIKDDNTIIVTLGMDLGDNCCMTDVLPDGKKRPRKILGCEYGKRVPPLKVANNPDLNLKVGDIVEIFHSRWHFFYQSVLALALTFGLFFITYFLIPIGKSANPGFHILIAFCFLVLGVVILYFLLRGKLGQKLPIVTRKASKNEIYDASAVTDHSFKHKPKISRVTF